MEDIEIIDLYWNRNETAVKETDNKYGGFCHSLAMNILSVWEDAEECVSDSYQKAWNSIPPERPSAFQAWLGTLTAVDRALFVRRYWNGEQLQSLAESSETTPNKLAGRMFRLRKSLQNYLTTKGVAL